MLPPSPPKPSLWLRWKSLKFFWRKKWIVGQDLSGVTFWEHTHNPISANRLRRTAVYPRHTHPGDVLLTPAWLQWLRHTRPTAPTLHEQLAERQRQADMLVLAAEADRKWAEKPSFLDKPRTTEPEALLIKDRAGYGAVGRDEEVLAGEETSGVVSAVGSEEEVIRKGEGEDVVKGRFKEGAGGTQAKEKPNPWKREQGGPSEGWKPEAWTPGNIERR